MVERKVTALTFFNVFCVGSLLGVIFIKTEVARWQRIHEMFLFQDSRMYLIICTAIAVAGVTMRVLKRLGVKSVEGKPIEYSPKPFHKGVVLGGVLFGVGWALAGACPGPIYAQLGAGEPMALFTFAGALSGMFCYAAAKPYLPH